MNFRWIKKCSTMFNNFSTLAWNIMKPTQCTLYSFMTFQPYHEHNKRCCGLGDFNVTNKINKQPFFLVHIEDVHFSIGFWNKRLCVIFKILDAIEIVILKCIWRVHLLHLYLRLWRFSWVFLVYLENSFKIVKTFLNIFSY